MKTLEQLSLAGLRIGSAQTLGAFRLIPLLRDGAPGDLRIRTRSYADAPAVVTLAGERAAPSLAYTSYVPHGFVIAHTKDGTEATFGATLGSDKQSCRCVNILHRMVKEERSGATSELRILPLHLAMEGFLALQFGGPDIAWREYSETALRFGLDPRVERSVRGSWLSGFEEALRVFEVAENQVGTMVFVADALASVFVVSHPGDYKRLHRSLIEDFFGHLVYEYALLYPDTPRLETRLDGARIKTVLDLRREVARARDAWTDYAKLLTTGLFEHPVRVERVRTMGPFRLERFAPQFDPERDCHIGERIVREDGTLEYMKTFRLSAAQVRRGHLLEQLAAAGWELDLAARALRTTRDELIKRLVNAGFGYLLKPSVLAAARQRASERSL